MTYRIDLKDLPRELLKVPQEDKRRVLKAIHITIAMDAHRLIQQSLSGSWWSGEVGKEYYQPVDTGDYKAAWLHELYDNGGVFFSNATPPVKAGVIEKGRRPGKGIPLDPLQEWVRRKFGENDLKKARRIAYLISRKHKAKGRPGLGVMERARPHIRSALQLRIIEELKRGR
jgi:hypothetical protein